jgi:hypothetical protein
MQHWFGIKLGHQAAALDGIAKQGRLVRRLVRKTQDGTLGQATSEPEDLPEDDDMGVRVGDEINYHLHQPQSAPASGGLASAARTALLVGLGAAAGAGPLVAWNALRPAATPPTPAAVQPGIDPLRYGFSISSGKDVPSQPGNAQRTP